MTLSETLIKVAYFSRVTIRLATLVHTGQPLENSFIGQGSNGGTIAGVSFFSVMSDTFVGLTRHTTFEEKGKMKANFLMYHLQHSSSGDLQVNE